MAEQRKIRAKYAVKPLGMQPVTYDKCSMSDDPNGPKLKTERVTEDRECFMVLFPQGHSIRVTSREELVRMGYDKKPRMIDMETGDVVDVGGDPYDFANMPDMNVVVDDGLPLAPAKKKTADANA